MENGAQYLPDDRVVSRETLAQLASSPIALTPALGGLVLAGDLATVPAVAQTTEQAVLRLVRFGEGPAPESLGAVPRHAVAEACQRAAVAGYLFARALLGTHSQAVSWSTAPEGADTFARVHRMAMSFGYPEDWGELSIEAIRSFVEATGFADPMPSEPIGSAASVAFDHAVGIALVEHDRWLGRQPAS